MIVYDYDSNAILAKAMISRSEHEMIRAYETIHQYLVSRGLRPKLQRLDNEASTKLKEYMCLQNINYQLAPPHCHRRNAAERAIWTFKNHFVAGLASTNKPFPLHLWDRLIPQVVMTLNLLQQSCLCPQLSANAQLNNIYDYNRNPMAPPGNKIIVHEKPSQQGTWATHGAQGWSVRTSP
jgi:hypothetical protein